MLQNVELELLHIEKQMTTTANIKCNHLVLDYKRHDSVFHLGIDSFYSFDLLRFLVSFFPTFTMQKLAINFISCYAYMWVVLFFFSLLPLYHLTHFNVLNLFNSKMQWQCELGHYRYVYTHYCFCATLWLNQNVYKYVYILCWTHG